MQLHPAPLPLCHSEYRTRRIIPRRIIQRRRRIRRPLISATLIAEADKLLRDGRLLIGRAESIISASFDPLYEPPGEYYDPLENLPDW